MLTLVGKWIATKTYLAASLSKIGFVNIPQSGLALSHPTPLSRFHPHKCQKFHHVLPVDILGPLQCLRPTRAAQEGLPWNKSPGAICAMYTVYIFVLTSLRDLRDARDLYIMKPSANKTSNRIKPLTHCHILPHTSQDKQQLKVECDTNWPNFADQNLNNTQGQEANRSK